MKSGREFLVGAARVGYATRGLLYVTIGGLAAMAAFGAGGETIGARGALREMIVQPFGTVLLLIASLGLVGFGIWRLLQAFADADARGRSAKALVSRTAWAISGFVHLGLSVFAFSLILGRGTGSDDDQAAQDWTATLLQQPLGRWLVIAAGLAVIAGGMAVILKGWREKFTERMNYPSAARRWIIPLGKAGYIARGITFAAIGAFLIVAALRFNPAEARGLGGALQVLRDQPFGPVLFAAVAVGLLAFGLFGFAQARYRRIDAPDPATSLSLRWGGAGHR